MEEFQAKTPTDGFIHIYSTPDTITKTKPTEQMTVDLMYWANKNCFLDADGTIYPFHGDTRKPN